MACTLLRPSFDMPVFFPSSTGQTRPTRVIRLLAEDTVEAQVLEVQQRKQDKGEAPADRHIAEVDQGLLLRIYNDLGGR